jgi:hypothetical protein
MKREAKHTAVVPTLGDIGQVQKLRLVRHRRVVDKREDLTLPRDHKEPVGTGFRHDHDRILDREIWESFDDGPVAGLDESGLGKAIVEESADRGALIEPVSRIRTWGSGNHQKRNQQKRCPS